MNTQLERMDKKTSVASVTISELKSRVHILETAMETNLNFDPHADQPSWEFPGELVELNTSEIDVSFHEEKEELGPPSEQQQTGEDLAMGGEPQEHRTPKVEPPWEVHPRRS